MIGVCIGTKRNKEIQKNKDHIYFGTIMSLKKNCIMLFFQAGVTFYFQVILKFIYTLIN